MTKPRTSKKKKVDRQLGTRGEAERFSPADSVPIMVYEHLHRYVLAATCLAERRVLDLASGSGYGSRILEHSAQSVFSLDLDREAARMAPRGVCGSGLSLPFASASFDAVVCMETLEHVANPEVLLGEISRVLRADGIAVLSTPDREIYTDRMGNQNPYHISELNRVEFLEQLSVEFPHVRLYGQSIWAGSWIAELNETGEPLKSGLRGPEALLRPDTSNSPASEQAPWVDPKSSGFPAPMYLVALCGRSQKAVAAVQKKVGHESILHDPEQWLLGHYMSALEALVDRHQDVEGFERHARNLEDDLVRSSERIRGLLEHTKNLESMTAERETRVHELEEQIQFVQEHQEATLAKLREQGEDFESILAERETRGRELEAQIQAAQEHHEANAAGLREHAKNLESILAERETRGRELEAQTQAVQEHHEANAAGLLEHAKNLESMIDERGVRVGQLEEQTQVAQEEHEVQVAGLVEHAKNLESMLAERETRVRELEERAKRLDSALIYRALRAAKLLD